jgi:hypothetical protein
MLLPADGGTIVEGQEKERGCLSIDCVEWLHQAWKNFHQLLNSCSIGWSKWMVVQIRCLEVAISKLFTYLGPFVNQFQGLLGFIYVHHQF